MSFLDEMRSQLMHRAGELGVRDAKLQKHLRGQDGRLEQDFSDRVAYTEMDEVIEQLDTAAREEIGAIQRALERIDAGTYMTCAVCGADIPEGRLRVVPYTPVCVNCAAALD